MAVRPTVPDAELVGKELMMASPDLLGALVKRFADSLMSAEADARDHRDPEAFAA